eukprot:8967127-Pyramimonas_sp.AAC.1
MALRSRSMCTCFLCRPQAREFWWSWNVERSWFKHAAVEARAKPGQWLQDRIGGREEVCARLGFVDPHVRRAVATKNTPAVSVARGPGELRSHGPELI